MDDLRTQDPAELEELISTLTTSDDPSDSAIGLELEALESIYPGSLVLSSLSPSPSRPSTPSAPSASTPHRLRYEITIPAWEDDEAPRVRVLVTLPAGYPDTAPQLQIMGRYVGNYAIEAGLFGAITRAYISSTGVPFTPGAVAVFEGLMYVQSLVEPWYRERAEASAAAEAAQQAERSGRGTPRDLSKEVPPTLPVDVRPTSSRPVPAITTSEPIVDRKSSFVGHACRVTDEEDVMAVVAHLLQDKRIARAAHPTIWAYRTAREAGGAAGRIVESDYDDDGETQAGSRLKHLLEVLDLTGVLVVVTRWFGGIHLGPDRFKHINQAARDALEAGGFLEEVEKSGKKGKRRA